MCDLDWKGLLCGKAKLSSLALEGGSLLALEGVLCLGFAKLSSRDQVGC